MAGKGEGLWSGMRELVSQAEGRVSEMAGSVEKRGTENAGATGLRRVQDRFSIWPRVLAEVSWQNLAAQGAPVTPWQLSLVPGGLISEQVSSSPPHRREAGSGRHREASGKDTTKRGPGPGSATPTLGPSPNSWLLGLLPLKVPSNAPYQVPEQISRFLTGPDVC